MTVSGFRATILIALGMIAVPFAAAAQQAMPQPAPGGGPPQGGGMPDLRAISGKPLPDRGMATGTVTVRVARQIPANPVAGVEVKALLEAPGGESRMRTAKTDAGGRALFEALPVGHSFHAEVVVDREKLTTETFTVPELGGVRTMLIAALGPGDAATGAAGAAGERGAAGAGAGKQPFTLGLIAGTVTPDGALPNGTVEVTALDDAGKPLADKVIELGYVRAGAQVDVMRAQTNSSGTARFTGVGGAPATGGAKAASPPSNPGDLGAAVVMQHGGLRLGTEGFGFPGAGGVKVELRVPGRTADPSVITIGEGGRVILQVRDDVISFIETLPLKNHSDKLFDPGPGGVEIRLPSEFVSAEAAEGEHKIEIRKGVGVAVHGIIPPHRPQSADPNRKSPDEVTFGFVLPLTGSTREFEQKFTMGMGEFTFITDQLPGLTIESDQITGRQERELGGKKYWLMRGHPIPPGGTLRFTVRGLPAPDKTGRIIAGSLALALVGAAFLFGRKTSGEKQLAASERDKLVQRREKLFSELVAMDTRDVADRTVRGELVQKLETVYRELAALDERHAV